MTGLLDAAWVIARRDFVATVYSRSFIFFLLAPLLLLGFSLFVGQMAARTDLAASQPTVAIAADRATTEALLATHARLAARMSERSLPTLRRVDPAEDVRAQARILLADNEAGLSAVFSGTLAQPMLSGPGRIDDFVTRRMGLLVEEAQREAALQAGVQAGGAPFRAVEVTRDVTGEAAGNLREIRTGVARGGQMAIFFLTLMLAGLLLSNLVEEKSNKVIEVLAAAVSLDAVFLGKLIAMLGISLVGLLAWGGMLAAGAMLSLQLLPAGYELPTIAPAVGWPVYIVLLLAYYTANYMLLGSLFLGIGSQASNIREIQTLSMPITFLQLGVLLLAMTVIGADGGAVAWVAYIFPFSSPLSMIAFAGQSELLWPHALALAWQTLWVVITIRVAAGLFRKTVLKSGGKTNWLPRFGMRRS